MPRPALAAASALLLPAALVLAACNPDSAPVVATDDTPAPPPASAPWDYATPQIEPDPAGEAAAGASTPDAGPIPVPFRAVWAIEEVDCMSQPGLTRITIGPSGVQFYEGRSEVLSASSGADGRLDLEVDHMAEGMTERQRQTLRLSGDARALTYTRGEQTFLYSRCPA